LTAAAAVIAELDCLCSFALVARELGYCRPVLTQDNVLHIKGGEAYESVPAAPDNSTATCIDGCMDYT